MNEPPLKLFLVDDDSVFLKLLEIEFNQHDNFIIETYSTGESCVKNLSKNPDVIVLDYYLNGIDKMAMNGIETLNKIKAFDDKILVLMLSSQDKIEVALDCMQHKAFDYIMKNKTAYLRLPEIISTIFNYKKNDVLN